MTAAATARSYDLARALRPRTVAVVGSKRADGYMWLRNYSTFQGPLYSVQIDPNEIPGIEAMGVKNYTSLLEVPDDIDYVMLAVPRHVAPRVLADCAKKRAGGVALFTSGFAETGEDDGIRLQAELLRIAQEGEVPLIGPNCMGLYNRALGIRQSGEQAAGEGGEVGFIGASGTHSINFGLVGEAHGVRVSTSISIGNAIILDVPDYLDYLADDAETKVIAMYVEGVRDGRRFVRSLKRAAAMKPVVVWKGGVTEAGARATASHTGALATRRAVFDAIVKQAGALPAYNLEDTIDVVKALLYAKPATGADMGLMAMTGGQSVVITDAFEGAGLHVPRLSERSYDELRTFFNIVGGSYQNPLDMGGTIGFGGAPGNLQRLLDILDRDPNVDAIAMEMASGFLARMWRANPASLDAMLDTLAEHRDRSPKPFVVVLQPQHVEEIVIEARKKVQERRIAVFASFERAARALRRAVDYHRFSARLD
jgi:acyl-CoA synthetase (NDP forming)